MLKNFLKLIIGPTDKLEMEEGPNAVKKYSHLICIEEDDEYYKGRVVDGKFQESTLAEEDRILKSVSLIFKGEPKPHHKSYNCNIRIGGAAKMKKGEGVTEAEGYEIDEEALRNTWGDSIINKLLNFSKKK